MYYRNLYSGVIQSSFTSDKALIWRENCSLAKELEGASDSKLIL